MQLTVKGKQIDVGDSLRTHVRDSLITIAEKYFSDPIEGTVVFSRDGHLFRADIAVHAGKRILLQANALANEIYPAFDSAAEKIAKRLRRYKRRLRDHHTDAHKREALLAQYAVLAAENDNEPALEHEEPQKPVVIAEMTSEIETMTVSHAVMRLDLADLPALLFKNEAHGGMNLVYRRSDGNIGWLDPAGNRTSPPSNTPTSSN
jgi:ribosomal subunit interface protein